MRPLLILGCGGHGKVVADAASACGYSDIAFLDDASAGSSEYKVLGPIAMLDRLRDEWPEAFVAIGHGETRLDLFRKLLGQGFQVPNIVHPASLVSRRAELEAGVFVGPAAVVNAGARIESGAIINTGAIVEHDCHIGLACHVSPGATLSGHVTMDELAWVGTGCSIRQGVTIGAGALVGVGAAVVSDVAPGETVVGVPARPMRNQRRT